jgi:hypothetical protein
MLHEIDEGLYHNDSALTVQVEKTDYHHCGLSHFTINGTNSDISDFGHVVCSKHGCDWGCSDLTFEPKPSTPKVLEENSITQPEYLEICALFQEYMMKDICNDCV